ncbi:MAG: SpoIID/LytB domain-containing protein, partial [Patescibacteria group bacterium]|nr:SpoIID/LytB domain-containing protein [Patescibacteria group bacterium]
IAARSYALAVTNGGQTSICATQYCQVYNHNKAFDGAAAEWHRAVAETSGQVLTSGGSPIPAYYASTAGGYTRLPSDFDVRWNSTNPAYLKRVVDFAGDGRAFDGPGYGNSPWYYKVWYAASDVHPWLTEAEMKDLLNAALLPEAYNSHLSHPDLGGWSYEQVVGELNNLGIGSVSDISSISVMNSGEGYTSSLQVVTSSGVVGVDGIRFWQVYKLRSRGHLALWSSLYDIVKI